MKKSLLILGLGDFGSTMAREFINQGYDVLGVDISEERVQEMSDVLAKVIRGDATSPALWRDLPTKQVEIGVVAFSSDTGASLQAALLLKKSGIKTVVAKSVGALHTELLNSIGVDRVIDTDKEAAMRAVHILGSNVEEYMAVTSEFGVARIKANKLLEGMTIRTLYEKHNATVAILQRGGRLLLEPPDTEQIRPGDVLVVAGTDRDLRSIPGVDRPQEHQEKDEEVV